MSCCGCWGPQSYSDGVRLLFSWKLGNNANPNSLFQWPWKANVPGVSTPFKFRWNEHFQLPMVSMDFQNLALYKVQLTMTWGYWSWWCHGTPGLTCYLCGSYGSTIYMSGFRFYFVTESSFWFSWNLASIWAPHLALMFSEHHQSEVWTPPVMCLGWTRTWWIPCWTFCRWQPRTCWWDEEMGLSWMKLANPGRAWDQIEDGAKRYRIQHSFAAVWEASSKMKKHLQLHSNAKCFPERCEFYGLKEGSQRRI